MTVISAIPELREFGRKWADQVNDRAIESIDEHGKGFEETHTVFRMNSYDDYAMEESVQIKERFLDVVTHIGEQSYEHRDAFVPPFIGVDFPPFDGTSCALAPGPRNRTVAENTRA